MRGWFSYEEVLYDEQSAKKVMSDNREVIYDEQRDEATHRKFLKTRRLKKESGRVRCTQVNWRGTLRQEREGLKQIK